MRERHVLAYTPTVGGMPPLKPFSTQQEEIIVNNHKLLAVVCLSLGAVALFSQTMADSPSEWQLVLPGDVQNMFTDGSDNYYATMNVGVQKSVDKGTNWSTTSYNPPLQNGGNTSLGGVSDSSYGLFVGSLGNGLWRSIDSGASWTNTFSSFYGTRAQSILSTGNTLLMAYTGLYRGIYKWDSNTSAWNLKFNTPPSVDGNSSDFSDFTVDNQSAIYATAWSPNHWGGIYKSSDAGETWTEVLATQFQANPVTIEWSGGYLYAIQNSGGLLRSSDHGQTWDSLTTLTTNSTDMISTPNGTLYASFLGAGVMESTNSGSTWQSYTNGLPSLNCNSLTVADGSLFVATDQGLFETALIPEPSTAAMVLVGLGGLTLLRRRIQGACNNRTT